MDLEGSEEIRPADCTPRKAPEAHNEDSAAAASDGSGGRMDEEGASSNVSFCMPAIMQRKPSNPEAVEEEAAASASAAPSDSTTLCGICHKSASPKVFTSDPCGCLVACKKCAMKMATGGKCLACKQYYTGFKSR